MLASGVTPARKAEAGGLTEVPQAWELSASVRLPLLFILFHCG